MPRPVYIVCAESVSHDKGTNLISLFHVLEGYTFSPPPVDAGPVVRIEGSLGRIPTSGLDFFGVANWARESSDDPKDLFEFVLEFSLPWEDGVQTINQGEVRFTKNFQRFMARIVVGIGKFPEQGGDIKFISKIRRSGSEGEWLSQEYRIPVTISNTSESE
jgi:hypothetical protein